ncbi:MAG: molybdopterin-dependent oxidoreductase [Desulfobacteraceae bacterium]|nr:MAG: molybdopterin-dependent oxidoreductase [Desulfobacteraceae bacterium]
MSRCDFSIIGKGLPRNDAWGKATGAALYTDDLKLSRMLVGKIKRSPHAHARILSIDTKKAEALSGVKAVLIGTEAPNLYGIMPQTPTESALAIGKVRFVGEGVVAVAAIDEDTASEALALIDVEYEPLPAYLTPEEALKEGAVPIHEDKQGNNIIYEGKQSFGDVDQALSDSACVLEKTISTQYVNHSFMEPHSALAKFDEGGRLTLWSSSQIPHYLHRTLSLVLGMPMQKIRVILPTVGGGFGGKGEVASNELCAALLARKTWRPVKITFERQEVFYTNKGRHPMRMHIEVGVDESGILKAIDFDTLMDGGAYLGWGVVVMFYCAAMLHLPYKVQNVRFRGRRVYTNKPTCGAMRGLGGVQPRFALETMLDEIALKLGMSPYELKRKNAVESGHTTALNNYVRHSEYTKCLDSVVKRSGYLEKRGKLPFGKGIGLAGGHYSSGTAYTLYLAYKPHSSALIRVDTESGVSVYCGAADIGQGSDTVLRMIAAETLGVPYSDVKIYSGDTDTTPFDLGAFSSRITVACGHAVEDAAREINQKLYGVAAVSLGVQGEQLISRNGKVFSRFEQEKSMDFWEMVEKYISAYGPLTATGHYTPPRRSARGKVQGGNIGHSPTYGFTAQVAEVEVDTETGEVRVLKVTESGDCGQAINPINVEGQVEGSIVMGMGQALFEEMVIEGDQVINPNLHEYRIPTIADMPEMDTEIVESYDPESPFGAKECGEGPIQPVIPAILNAIYDAIGVRFHELPVTPERVLAALHKPPAS